jgi:acetyl-CoA acyltransferase 1
MSNFSPLVLSAVWAMVRVSGCSQPLTYSVPINTLNRQCSSGLTAIAQIANSIRSGEIDIGLAAGVEHMTAHYGAGVLPERMSDAVLSNPESADCMIPMGITSENVAKQYSISRDVQDAFAAKSFEKAAKAQREGKFKEEIVPVKVCRQSVCYRMMTCWRA